MREPISTLGARSALLFFLGGCVPSSTPVEPKTPFEEAEEEPEFRAPSGQNSLRGRDYVAVPEHLLPPELPELAFDGAQPLAQVIYMHRGGGTYNHGANTPSQNIASVIPEDQTVQVPAYEGSDGDWQQLLDCVRSRFAQFNAEITEQEPGGGPYIEVVVGGTPGLLSQPDNVGGIAPVDLTTCRLLDSAVVFVFSAQIPDAPQTCALTAHEIGHALSLDHAFLCEDPMSYLSGCGEKTFQNVNAACGEEQARACSCERPHQNSVEIIHDKLGDPNALSDLAVARLSVSPVRVRPGERITIRYARINQGPVESGAFADAYRIEGGPILRTVSRTSLQAGQTKGPFNLTIVVPEDVPAGDHRLIYEVDASNAVMESDESNNTRSVSLTILEGCRPTCPACATAGVNDGCGGSCAVNCPTSCEAGVCAGEPDLVAGALSVDATTVSPGGRVRLTYGRRNEGGTASDAFADGYYLSTNTTITSADTLLSSSNRSALAAGASLGPFSRSLTIPMDTNPGDYFLGYFVDHRRAVAEARENNNTSAIKITVEGCAGVCGPPDLTATLSATQTSVKVGERINVSYTRANEGGEDSGSFRDGYFLSTNSIISAQDVQLSAFTRSSLEQNAQAGPFNRSLTIPEGTQPGTYWIGYFVDQERQVAESNESNNTASVQITIVP